MIWAVQSGGLYFDSKYIYDFVHCFLLECSVEGPLIEK